MALLQNWQYLGRRDDSAVKEHWLFLQGTRIHFPAHMHTHDGSQLSVSSSW